MVIMFITKGGHIKTIAISAAKKSLEAPLEALFGRARFFILADPVTLEWEAFICLFAISCILAVIYSLRVRRSKKYKRPNAMLPNPIVSNI